MYSVLIALAIALAVALICVLYLGIGIFWSVLIGLLALVATWILIARRVGKKVTPAFQQVQQQTQAGMIRPALDTLGDLLPVSRWMPMLKGQIHGQMGILAFYGDDPETARRHLEKASRRVTDAQLVLASMQYSEGDVPASCTTLEQAAAVNRRNGLVHNVHAWILYKEGRTDEAMAVLQRHLKKEKDSQTSKDNLLRLQNGRKLNMKPFGMQWYALRLEKPPASMGQMQTGRKGFRQPPKKRKGRR